MAGAIDLSVWGISSRKHADEAFTGEGSANAGGRWNPKGIRVVYTSGSLALAALETFVNSSQVLTTTLVYLAAEIPSGLTLQAVSLAELPSDWNTHPLSESTQEIGAKWIERCRSAVLRVPSVVVPPEANYLLNPAHPDFRKLRIGKPERFQFDARMWK